MVVGPGTGFWDCIEIDDRREQPVDTRFDVLVRVDRIGLHLGADGRRRWASGKPVVTVAD